MKAHHRILVACCLMQAAGVWADSQIKAVAGRVEIRKAGQTGWALAGCNTVIANNDMLRTGPDGRAEVSHDDGSEVLLAPSSQILFNYAGSTGNRRLATRYATAFFGAIYFVVREALPKPALYRIYTPTAVLTIRGTRFGVTVDPVDGATLLEVTSGTVMAKNLIVPGEYYVKTGQRTRILLNQPALAPSLISAERNEELRKWVGEKRMRPARDKQQSRAALQQQTILVLPLGDFSGFQGPWNLSMDMANLVARALGAGSGFNVVVVDDRRFELDELAQLHNARRVVTGEVEVFELSRQVRMRATADRLSEKCTARIGLNLMVLDPSSQSLVQRLECTEELEMADCAGDLKRLSKTPLDPADPVVAASALGKALDQVRIKVATLKTALQ